jgi:hypothetical protein
MALDFNRLTNLVELAGGIRRARCPACAENGQDKTGEHLRIYPDGRFGCCVFPADQEHRRRIFALSGEHGRQAIRVRQRTVKVSSPVSTGILGRLASLFPAPPPRADSADLRSGARPEVRRPGTPGTERANSHGDQETTPELGTFGTGSPNPKPGSTIQAPEELELFGTPGTPDQNSRVYAKEVPSKEEIVCTQKESFRAVPSVPACAVAQAQQPAEPQSPMPYINPKGTLVIPLDCPERYHWWKGGQSVTDTMVELRSGQIG